VEDGETGGARFVVSLPSAGWTGGGEDGGEADHHEDEPAPHDVGLDAPVS